MANIENLKGHGFDVKPGNINRKGQPKKLPSLDVLLADVFSEDEIKKILRALQKSALKGNTRAMEILLDRIYGRVKQQTEISGSVNVPPITGIQIIVSNDSKD